MGIKGLTKLIRDNCPGAIKETVLKGYTGMKVCIDASNALYQFMVAIRSMGQGGSAAAQVNFVNVDLPHNFNIFLYNFYYTHQFVSTILFFYLLSTSYLLLSLVAFFFVFFLFF